MSCLRGVGGDGGAGRGPPRRPGVHRRRGPSPLSSNLGLRRCWADRRTGACGTARPVTSAGL